MEKLCTNKNHSYKHNEQIHKQNIDNSERLGVKYVKIYLEMTSQWFFEKNVVLVDYIGIFLHFRILLTDDCTCSTIQQNPIVRIIMIYTFVIIQE